MLRLNNAVTMTFIKSLPRENTIFHYNEDGSIDVLEISDRKLREAIRRTYKDTNSSSRLSLIILLADLVSCTPAITTTLHH
jgi:hypothetical protein